MKKAVKIGSRIIQLNGILAVFVLIFMMFLTVADVFSRHFFSKAIPGSTELIVILMVFTAFLGMGLSALRNDHISVDIISGKLSKSSGKVLDAINYLVAIGYSILIIKQSYSQALFLQKLNSKTQTWGIPQYPLVLVVTFGTLLLLLAVLILLYNVGGHRETNQRRERGVEKDAL